MELTKSVDFDDAIGYFFDGSEYEDEYAPLSEKEWQSINDIVTYAPKDVSFMILKKLPPIFILRLSRDNERVKHLFTDEIFLEEYRKIWNYEINEKYKSWPGVHYRILKFFEPDVYPGRYDDYVDDLRERVLMRKNWEIMKEVPSEIMDDVLSYTTLLNLYYANMEDMVEFDDFEGYYRFLIGKLNSIDLQDFKEIVENKLSTGSDDYYGINEKIMIMIEEDKR